MGINYIDNSCFATGAAEPLSGQGLECNESNRDEDSLPVVDAVSYVNKTLPLPENAPLQMARLFELPEAIAIDFRDDRHMRFTLDRISSFVEVHNKQKIDNPAEVAPDCREKPDSCAPGVGYDLRLEDVAAFYTTCRAEGRELLAGERFLRAQLVDQGLLIIADNGEFQAASPAVLIGMSQTSDNISRRATFVHEYSHALYLLDPKFRSKVSALWSSLEPDVQKSLRGAMISSGFYAAGQDWLIETEAQAHAIAPTKSSDGVLNFFLWAMDKCDKGPSQSKSCQDFLSYRGDVNDMLNDLHELYFEATECDIPLLGNWMSNDLDETILATEKPPYCPDGRPNTSEEGSLPQSTEYSELIKMLSISIYDSSIESLQTYFDSYHPGL